MLIHLEKLGKSFGEKIVLHDVTASVEREDRIGIVGQNGVLQDSHWSGGSIGYFPSYALGSAYGAQLLRKMKETVDVDECLKTGNFAPINAWNREHIWQYGCLKKPGALLEQALGEKFDPTVYTQYLEEKYGEIYGL